MKMTREYKTLTKYTDLSDFVITFDPLTHSDKRWKQIFEDQYARVIFAGYRINHLVDDELDILMEEALNVGNEIRSGKLQLEHEPLKNRLKEMFIKFCLVNPLIRQAIVIFNSAPRL